MVRRFTRRGTLKLVGGTIGTLGTVGVGSQHAVDTAAGELLDGSIIVFESTDAIDELDRFDVAYRTFEVLPMAYVRGPQSVLETIEALDVVRAVVPNRRLEWFNDRTRASIGADDVQSEYDGSGVRVAVIDSGVNPLHPDLDVVENYQWVGNPIGEPTFFVDAGPVDTDEIGHGTHCAGTVAGDGEASDGELRGVAPGASITSYSTGAAVSVLKSAAAYDHLLANHTDDVDVVTNSYGTAGGAAFSPNDPVNVASYEAFDRGIFSAFAAGNDGPDAGTLSDFAKAPHVVGVGATDGDGPVASFSSRGIEDGNHDRDLALSNLEAFYDTGEADGPLALQRPGVCAPGVDVTSTASPYDVLSLLELGLTEPLYGSLDGTSMACPAVAGVAALAIEASRATGNGTPDPRSIIDAMEDTATPLDGSVADVGRGLVDAPNVVDRFE